MVRPVTKLLQIDELADIGGVLCHGCFDLLHVGHIRHLQMARRLSKGPLTVTITSDRFVTKNKGEGRPIVKMEERAECLAALACVDFVSIIDRESGLYAIHVIRPSAYVKGKEYEGQGGIAAEESEAVHQYGGRMFYTDRWESSTRILELLNERVKSVRAD